MNITALWGKTYAWVQATQTGQWRLVRVPDVTDETFWDRPGADVIGDLRASLRS